MPFDWREFLIIAHELRTDRRESPRSRGLSEHGVFSCEECCIPAHMQG